MKELTEKKKIFFSPNAYYNNFVIFCFQVGFLCIVVAPWRGKQFFMARPFDHINMMLVRWLLFRMMFASGVVKLTSQCPTWWGLTAMPTHYVMWPQFWSLKELKWLFVTRKIQRHFICALTNFYRTFLKHHLLPILETGSKLEWSFEVFKPFL